MSDLRDRGGRTPEENARRDLQRHLDNGWDLNPFSTEVDRWLWQMGFNGEPFDEVWGTSNSENARIHARGKAAAKLVKERS